MLQWSTDSLNMFFTGLFILCLIIGILTLFSMLTMNQQFYTNIVSYVTVILASGSWFVMGGLTVMSIMFFVTGNYFFGIGMFFNAVLIFMVNWVNPPKIFGEQNNILTISTVNVLNENKSKGLHIGRELLEADPDIVFIQEYTPEIGAGMEPFLDRYAYCSIAEKGEDEIPDLAIYSKFPLLNSRTIYSNNRPALVSEIEYEKQFVTLVNIHTVSPTNPSRTIRWFDELEGHITMLRTNNPMIVAGDFNASVSHAPFRRLLKEANLSDFTSLLTTWGYKKSLPELLHLDHILGTRDFRLLEKPVKSTGEDSDHCPVTVKVSIITESRY